MGAVARRLGAHRRLLAHPQAERWVFGQGWSEAGDLPLDLVEASSQEIGPAFLLGDGRVFYAGATGHTAFFTAPSTWVAGPDLPTEGGALAIAKDSPGVLLPNGHVLVTGSAPGASGWGGPTSFYDFDVTVSPPTVTAVAPPSNSGQAPYEGRLMLLPSGEVAYTQGTAAISYRTVAVTAALPGPEITSAPTSAVAGSQFVLQGHGFNGVSQTVMYGDDAQQATNYPLVRLTRLDSAAVTYARTFDHSTMGVATGAATVSTHVALPASLAPGAYQLQVVVNGIASAAVALQVTPATTCSGCFDASQACQPGNTAAACGTGGTTCASCGSGQACVGGSCQNAPCMGCLDASGTCQAGTATTACGAGGAVCAACAAGQACVGGVCQVLQCTGCLDASGACQPGTATTACGAGGAACTACAAGQTCVGGVCQQAACTGCRDAAGTCQSGTTTAACGTAGNSCVACAAGQSCLQGTCQNNAACTHGICAQGANIGATCDPCAASICAADAYCCTTAWDQICVSEVATVCHQTTCLGCGCVDGAGACQSGTNQTACGAYGSACQACAAGTVCTGGVCQQQVCGGCRDATGTCQLGNTNAACGSGGNACVSCGSGQACVNGVCQLTCHDLCVAGGAMAAACDPCAAQICATDPYCCQNTWDATCVAKVKSVCQRDTCQSCGCTSATGCQPGTSVTACGSAGAACVACAAGQACVGGACVAATQCAHATCTAGGPLAASCDSCAASVCAADPLCCTDAWDAQCVSEVASICHQHCP